MKNKLIRVLLKLNRLNLIYLSDSLYLKLKYRLLIGKKLNLSCPVTFNEKLQWLKLYDRKKIYNTMVDKYEVKEYVSNLIGKQYIIPTIGIYEKFDNIKFDDLPNQFVIKCTHDSGSVYICRNINEFDIITMKKKINKALKENYFYKSREWPYKNVKPRIIVEKYMEDNDDTSMRDYKFFCFNGKPEIMYISEGLENHDTARMSFFDMNFNVIDCKRKDYNLLDYKPKQPKNFDKMKSLASLLSKGIPHLRVDFYEINDKLYFGELTFFTCSGFVPFEDEKWNNKLGEMIDLKMVKKNEK